MIIEKNIKKTRSNTFKCEFLRNHNYIVKSFKTLQEAQNFKKEILLGKIDDKEVLIYKGSKMIKYKRFFYYTTKSNLIFLKKELNIFNPEIFDLSFIDSKYKLTNTEIINNILKSK